LAFTTTQGSGANDATTFVGTSGVDSINLINVATPVFLGAQQGNDVIAFNSNLYTDTVSGYTLRGGAGNDSITAATSVVFNAGFINGNAGNDTITLRAVESSTVFGGQGADIITTGALGNTRVNGNAGNDAITVANATSSSIFAGQGQDTITVSGAVIGSVIQGDNDVDGINLTGSYTSSTINGNAGNDTITVGAITAFTDSTVFGGAGDDTITAAASTVAVVISGDDGADILVGSNFADTIIGGDGNDTITGGLLADTMTGGAGVNRFVIAVGNAGNTATAVGDVITDFKTSASALTRDQISVGAFTAVAITDGAVAGYATYAAALADAVLTGGANNFIAAVGSGTSWTSVLFSADDASSIQLGTTGQFGTTALAMDAIVAAQIA
jgi:Ca2+-binding RTX toxin-like protein